MSLPLPPDLLAAFQAAGQAHVFHFWPELDDAQREQLLADARHIDPAAANLHYRTVLQQEAALLASPPTPADLSPFTAVTSLPTSPPSQRLAWYSEGLRAIAAGRVATVLMAGGQGTRLGSSAPKGCFDLQLPSHRSLFGLQADRIHRLRRLAAAEAGVDLSSVSLPWYIMTSIVTHDATVAYFTSHAHFDLPPTSLVFFQQRELPAFDLTTGLILLEHRHRIALSPNGNGGLFDALAHAHCIADMQRRGVETVHVYGVDNALVRVADPTLVGFTRLSGADCVNKVVLKREAHEKVGVMAMRQGQPHVVEYSEIPQALAELRDEGGQLVYSAGNIAQHCFTLPFLTLATTTPLPFHPARKAIPCTSPSTGLTSTPPTPNALKLEMFIFDVFAWAQSMRALAVDRGEEFSAVKNRAGVDSPETAREAVGRLHRRWVEEAGARVEGEGVVEVSGLLSYAGEGLAPQVIGRTFHPPILIA